MDQIVAKNESQKKITDLKKKKIIYINIFHIIFRNTNIKRTYVRTVKKR